ncbi:MAG: sugar ABC transporter permease [Rhodospirillales bacterium]|nr:sugar ABC transporter permease [Rhodospirillales bacterium]MDH3912512.1 sugar ABC transporter permease [Rhodospirillales bacterium]MDH3919039.1 sugar ABC transporter permease [Rhodospirillales bacterium]MDH3967853.1 sugar ABC transporter permease [Rhodospirillales bacterium]
MDRGVGPLFLVPALLLLVVLLVGPFLYMVGVSFTDLSFALPGHDGNFVGFENYRRLMREDPVFWQSFGTTLVFVSGVVSVEFGLGFALALLLFHHVQRRRFVLTLLLIPMMLAPVAVGLMWKLMLHGEFGMLTHYLRELGLLGPQTALLGNHDLVLPTVMLVDVWEWTPFVTLVFLAGLLSLPREPFEAAVMDGARPWQVFRDITVPLLRPIIALVLLLRGIDAFKEFDKVFILTGGGPGTATELISIYAWRVNFRNWDLGYGAVCAFMVYLVVLILCAVSYKAIYWTEGRAVK